MSYRDPSEDDGTGLAIAMLAGMLMGLALSFSAKSQEHAKEPKLATYRFSGECHEQPAEAIRPMLAEARRLMLRNGWEYGGILARRSGDGWWCATPPQTSEHPTRMRFIYGLPEGYGLRALYHTHPGSDFGTYFFSGTDVVSACLLGVLSYIVTEAKLVLSFTPTQEACQAEPIGPVVGRIIDMVEP